jgi:glucose-6-phosphate 1-dehydrogenase
MPNERPTNAPRARTPGNRRDRGPEPFTLVIFGATGDLTQRKLLPALYNLHLDGLLPESYSIVGSSRSPMSDRKFAEAMAKGVSAHSRRDLDPERWDDLARRLSYVMVDGSEDGYEELARRLDALEEERGAPGNRLFYLATPPSAFDDIVTGLGKAGLEQPGRNGRWSRVVVEKPTGHDLETASELNDIFNRVFQEKDVFRIDHYLGKETVQNLLVFRFANAIFEPLWNQKYVDHVQITVAETIGIEGRGKYFEEAGIGRDIVQNHMFQLLCLIAMEPPVSLAADPIRDEKVKVLQSLRPLAGDDVRRSTIRGQYREGVVDRQRVPGYREEPDVAPDSRTETYAAIRLHVDNWRWAGVPFYLRAGKRMPKRLTEISLQFREVPHRLFDQHPAPNTLRLQIQPDEGIHLAFDSKLPGSKPRIEPVTMDFCYSSAFGQEPPEAYERLILDAILGDSTLFIRRDEVEAAWAWIDRLEQAWSEDDSPLAPYPAGTWGPSEADVLLARDDRKWR